MGCVHMIYYCWNYRVDSKKKIQDGQVRFVTLLLALKGKRMLASDDGMWIDRLRRRRRRRPAATTLYWNYLSYNAAKWAKCPESRSRGQGRCTVLPASTTGSLIWSKALTWQKKYTFDDFLESYRFFGDRHREAIIILPFPFVIVISVTRAVESYHFSPIGDWFFFFGDVLPLRWLWEN